MTHRLTGKDERCGRYKLLGAYLKGSYDLRLYAASCECEFWVLLSPKSDSHCCEAIPPTSPCFSESWLANALALTLGVRVSLLSG